MATHSSTFAWRIPWMEEPHRLQSMGSLRVGHDSVTSLSLFTFTHWRKQWQPTPVLLPGESQGQRSLLGAVYGVTQSRTRLMPLSKSSSLMVDAQFASSFNYIHNMKLYCHLYSLSHVWLFFFYYYVFVWVQVFCDPKNCSLSGSCVHGIS